jgi:hypothetical protein
MQPPKTAAIAKELAARAATLIAFSILSSRLLGRTL